MAGVLPQAGIHATTQRYSPTKPTFTRYIFNGLGLSLNASNLFVDIVLQLETRNWIEDCRPLKHCNSPCSVNAAAEMGSYPDQTID